MTRTPIPNCPQPETPIRERAWADGQRQAEPKYSDVEINVLATECECGPSQAAVRYKTIAKVLRSFLAERAASRPSTPDKAVRNGERYQWLKMSAPAGFQYQLIRTPWTSWDSQIDAAMQEQSHD